MKAVRPLACKLGVTGSIPGFSSPSNVTKWMTCDNFPGQTADKDIL